MSTAWKIKDDEGEWIVIAKDEWNARLKGAYYFLTDVEFVEAKRSPEWDEFSELGYVPPKAMIEVGWQLTCYECESVVDEENEQEDEEGNEYYPEPVFEGQKVFCCQQCRDTWHRDRATEKQRKEEAIALLSKRYPKAQNIKAHGGSPGDDAYASFRFGNNKRAKWKSSDPDVVTIRKIDKAEWDEWKWQITEAGMKFEA
jgi:hypothetical protein